MANQVELAVSRSDRELGARVRTRSRFFLWMSVLLLVLVFLDFSRTFFLQPFFDVQAETAIVYTHGAVMTAWYLWLVLQASLVANKCVDLHRKLGVAGVVIGVAALALNTVATLAFAAVRAGDPDELAVASFVVWANFAVLIPFGIFLYSAIQNRRRPEFHKRFMLLASIGLVAPAVGRIADWSLWSGRGFMPEGEAGAVLILVALLGLYDLSEQGRLHGVTLYGGVFLVVLAVLGCLVIPSSSLGLRVVGMLG